MNRKISSKIVRLQKGKHIIPLYYYLFLKMGPILIVLQNTTSVRTLKSNLIIRSMRTTLFPDYIEQNFVWIEKTCSIPNISVRKLDVMLKGCLNLITSPVWYLEQFYHDIILIISLNSCNDIDLIIDHRIVWNVVLYSRNHYLNF